MVCPGCGGVWVGYHETMGEPRKANGGEGMVETRGMSGVVKEERDYLDFTGGD